MIKTPSSKTIYYANMLIVKRSNQLDLPSLSLMFAQVTQLTPNLLCLNNGD